MRNSQKYTARHKLNNVAFGGAFGIAAIIGLAFESCWAFFLAAGVLIAISVASGDIRGKKRG